MKLLILISMLVISSFAHADYDCSLVVAYGRQQGLSEEQAQKNYDKCINSQFGELNEQANETVCFNYGSMTVCK